MSTRIGALRRSVLALLAILAMGAVGGCKDLTVPEFNNPSVDELETSPTRTGAITASTGLLIGARSNIAPFNGYVSLTAVLGRESFDFDGSDTRFVTQLLGLGGQGLDPGARRLGGNLWHERYQNIRTANILLAALDVLPDVEPDGMTPEEKEATRGFAKTMQALDFLLLINTRDSLGVPIDVDRPVGEPPAPFATKAEVLDHIVGLLEEAKTHLEAGGSEFPFAREAAPILSSGFVGFDIPETFLQFNRALAARVHVYRMRVRPSDPVDAAAAQAALDALAESFVSTVASRDLGVYHAFGRGSGDEVQSLLDERLYANPELLSAAQLQANGVDIDDRALRKICEVLVDADCPGNPGAVFGITSNLRFTRLYPTPTTPVPIIRNEELILLRAEANIGLGNIGEAAEDINFIRTTSGNLPERNDLDASNILDELLYNKRYSLVFEGGHSWIDFRRYGRLGDFPVVHSTEGDGVVHSVFPIPVDETAARE